MTTVPLIYENFVVKADNPQITSFPFPGFLPALQEYLL